MTRTAKKILELVKAAGWESFPDEIALHRTYAGSDQKAAAAWAWYASPLDEPHNMLFGSQWQATELIKLGKVVVTADDNQVDVDPHPDTPCSP